ncbi:MAG: DUF975 family protein [Firmicutes bacterium]|nr:DUF975 family protein [Bacillota bacterium]
MWQRSDLKETAKEVLRRTYWMSVVVALIFGFVGGGGGGGFSFRLPYNSSTGNHGSSSYGSSQYGSKQDIINDAIEAAANRGEITEEEFNKYYNTDDLGSLPQAVKDELHRATDSAKSQMTEEEKMIILSIALFGLIIFLVALIVGTIISTFVLMPLQVGCYRYFIRARNEEGKVDDVIFAFKDNFKNVVWVMFVRMMKLMGWYCLLFIPGVIKSYEYAMIPYLLAENPAMSSEEAFETTRKMMDGNKFDMFVLGLSFIGWAILGVLTCGLGLVFYVNPYMRLTYAELYHTLKDLNGVDPLPQQTDEIVEGVL